jgi:RNA polymerase primary sigma factor
VAGFNFRYRLGGDGPTVESFQFKTTGTLSRGDILNLDGGMVALGKTGDETLLGVALDTKDGVASETPVDAIVDGDAVYGTVDINARLAGAAVNLAGATGYQGVITSSGADLGVTNSAADLVVIGESWATEETLVQINPTRHYRGPTESTAPEEEPSVVTDLTRQEERQLVSSAAASSAKAREELVVTYMPLIAGVARHYRASRAIDADELIQEGIVGMLRALKRFDPERGTPFWAYATWWVRQAMQQLLAERTGPMMLSDRAQRELTRINALRIEYLKEHQHEPTVGELAESAGLTREQVKRLLAAQEAPRGLDESRGRGRGEKTQRPRDTIPDPEAELEYENVLESIELEEVRHLAKLLSDRERDVLFSHYGIGRPAVTMREIGERLGISAERVRQIEQWALQKLRAAACNPDRASENPD